MKIIVIFTAVVVILVAALIIILDEDRRWLFVNGADAEAFASLLLKKETNIQTPNKFIDYTVSAENGFVIFSKQSNHAVIYGYFPNKSPSEIDLTPEATSEWKLLDENWFVLRSDL